MQHPKDVKGSDRPLPRNDGKFILDGKRVRFSDYGGSSKEASMSDYDKEVLTASELLKRLDGIEDWLRTLEMGRNRINSNLVDIEDRLNELEEGRHGIIRLD